MNAKEFFAFARERERIRLAREGGAPPPWTDDPVLQQYRFCNVFREDDAVTRAFRENLREPLRSDHRVFMACVAFRFFNTIEAAKRLDFLLGPGWSAAACRKAMRGVKPVTNAAYIVSTPKGKSKLEGVIEVISNVNRRKMPLIMECEHGLLEPDLVPLSMEYVHQWLCQFPFVGKFMAYEIVTDLSHTWMLEKAPDRATWASFGPGAARGLERLLYGCCSPELKPDLRIHYTTRAGQEQMMKWGHELLQASGHQECWPVHWPRWTMREVEHTLCEYDKWKRGQTRRLKRKFNGGGA